jgi:hypothetical protein
MGVVVVPPFVPLCPFAPAGGNFCCFEEGGMIPIPTASVASLATGVPVVDFGAGLDSSPSCLPEISIGRAGACFGEASF